MGPKTRRLTLRRYQTYAVEFGPRALKARYEGEIDNYSVRGMQFTSPVPMDRGDRIWIRAVNGQKPFAKSLSGSKIDAVVCWCHAEPKSLSPIFTIGVNF